MPELLDAIVVQMKPKRRIRKLMPEKLMKAKILVPGIGLLVMDNVEVMDLIIVLDQLLEPLILLELVPWMIQSLLMWIFLIYLICKLICINILANILENILELQ